MAANFSAASSVLVAGMISGHMCASEDTMLGQEEGISPESSGMRDCVCTRRKNSGGGDD